MPCLRLSVVAAATLLALSCGGGAPQPAALSSRWAAPPILSHVPADSPYLFALLEPISDALRQRMMQGFYDQMARSYQALDALRAGDRTKLEPWLRAVLAATDELRGKPPAAWFEHFGVDPRGRFAIYGLSMWPVMRIEIASPPRLRAVIERVLAAADLRPQQRTLDGHPYWLMGDGNVSVVAAVLDREAVAALVPTPVLDAALPLVLGTRAPDHSLAATTTVPDLLARHRLLGLVLAYVDARNIAAIVAGPQPGPLDIPIRAATGPVSPACRADLDRLAAIVPRLVLGYHRFDDAGFDASTVVELPAATVGALHKLRAAVPEVIPRPPGRPLFTLGAAIDPGELIAWLQATTRQLQDRPFRCPWFTGINEAGARLAAKLATPLPPTWRGLRGFAMTIDDASILPPDVTGHVLVAGERVADLVTSLVGAVPALAGIPLARDGKPIALPIQQLHLPTRSAHLALTTDRLVIAAGDGSDRRATAHLGSPAPGHSPLFTMSFDIPRLQKLLAALGQSPVQNLGAMRDVGFGVDIGDTGIDLAIRASWLPTPPAQIAAPPSPPARP